MRLPQDPLAPTFQPECGFAVELPRLLYLLYAIFFSTFLTPTSFSTVFMSFSHFFLHFSLSSYVLQ